MEWAVSFTLIFYWLSLVMDRELSVLHTLSCD